MGDPKHTLAGTLLMAAVLLEAGSALAQAPDPAAADALFEEGKALLATGDWAGACEKFRQSLARDRSVSTHIKVARCHERDNRLGSALTEYQLARELNGTLPQAPDRWEELQAVINAGIKELEPRVPRLRISVSPFERGVQILLDGKLAGTGPGAILVVDAGEHELVVRASGYREQRISATAVAGATKDIAIQLEELPARTSHGQPDRADAPPRPAVAERDEPQDSSRRTLSFVLGGAGLATLGVAGYFGVRTLVLVGQAEDHCEGSVCSQEGVDLIDRAGTAQTTGLILAGVGAGLVAAGVVLNLTAPAESGHGRPASLALELRPRVSLAAAGVRPDWPAATLLGVF